jgi:MFS transporter, FHS family, glucose/mannose:H+ symporter
MLAENSNKIRVLKVLLHAGFFISGIMTILIGQVLPLLANRFMLNDLQAGYSFLAQFSGSLIGTFLTSWFGKQNKFLAASLIGCFLMGVGILMLNLGSFELCLVGFFCNGIGVGLTLPSINMLIFELNPERPTAAVNVLNFFWGLGAIICSLTVNTLSKRIGFFPISAILAVFLFVIAGWLLFMPKGIEQNPAAETENAAEFSTPIWTNPIAWLIAFFNFIHVGFETGIGGWLPTYTERFEGQTYLWWLAPTFLYFLFFVVGRGVAPVFLRFLNENQMLFGGLLTILLGMGVLLFAKDVLTLGIGGAIAGFGTSSVFPTNMSRFTKTFGPSASRRAMPFFICGTLGATFTTWLIGFVSNRYQNDLRSGMFILLGSVLILIVLQLILPGRTRRFEQAG